MTISNKYNAGFCVLTIKVVGYAHVIWITKKMVENVLSTNFRKSMVVKSRSIHARDPVHGTHDSGLEQGQERRIESGVTNRV
jgi:hypothetical protein